MMTRIERTTSISTAALDDAALLLRATRAATESHGYLPPAHAWCLIAERDEGGWCWWLVGRSGEAMPATAEALALTDRIPHIGVYGWWSVLRPGASRPLGPGGAARVIVAEFVVESPLLDYATGPDGQPLTARIELEAGRTPPVVLWRLGGGSMPGWPR